VLDLLLIAVSLTDLFRRLLQQLCGHADVLHILGSRRHSLQDAQAVGFVGERNVGDFVEEAVAGAVEEGDPFFGESLPANLCRIVCFDLLPGYGDTEIFLDGLDHLRRRVIARKHLNDVGFHFRF